MNRKKTSLKKLHDPDDGGYADTSPAGLVSCVWELTKEVWSLGKRADVERRLQRNITHIYKRKKP